MKGWIQRSFNLMMLACLLTGYTLAFSCSGADLMDVDTTAQFFQ